MHLLVAEEDIEAALEFVNTVAAFTTTEAGAIAALPDRGDAQC